MGKGNKGRLPMGRIREAKYGSMQKGPPPETWSARMPAYCYTGLCADLGLRVHPADAGRGGGMDKARMFDVRKECRLCGRKYPALSGKRRCGCGGYLYMTGAYWQRKTGGGAIEGRR